MRRCSGGRNGRQKEGVKEMGFMGLTRDYAGGCVLGRRPLIRDGDPLAGWAQRGFGEEGRGGGRTRSKRGWEGTGEKRSVGTILTVPCQEVFGWFKVADTARASTCTFTPAGHFLDCLLVEGRSVPSASKEVLIMRIEG